MLGGPESVRVCVSQQQQHDSLVVRRIIGPSPRLPAEGGAAFTEPAHPLRVTPNMPLTDDELLASNPDAAGLIAAGVPREEVLQGLRTDSSREEEPVHVVQPIARMASIQRGSAP